MTSFNVIFAFEADSLEEAEKEVGKWKIPDGVTILGLTGMLTSDVMPLEIQEKSIVKSMDRVRRERRRSESEASEV